MAITMDWDTQVINVPQADLTPLGGGSYSLDLEQFFRDLRDIEDSEEGIGHLPMVEHITSVTLSGDTYARVIQIVNGYTVTFEDTGSPYRVFLEGANSNVLDVANLNNVSIAAKNSGGLIAGSGGATAADVWGFVGEGALTMDAMMRIVMAALSGRSSGIGTSQEIYKSVDGLKDRITVDFDANSNRVTVVLDGSV